MRKAHTNAGPEYIITLHKSSQVQHYYKPGFSYIKVNMVQNLDSGK
jgi:hypothetical protein